MTASPQSACGRSGGEEGVRHVIVERLAEPALVLLDPCARTVVGQSPRDDAVLEQLVEKIVESVGEAAPTSAEGQTADAVEHSPDGGLRETEAIDDDQGEVGGDPRFGPRPHHFGDDVLLRTMHISCMSSTH